jgi:hypothetical protein
MNIRIECPLCGFHKEVAPTFGGKEVKCPHCETKFTVPFPQVTTMEAAGNPRPKLAGSANGKSAPRPTAPRKSRRALIVVVLVLALAAGGTAAYVGFFAEHQQENAEAAPPAVASKPTVDLHAPDTHVATEKKAADDKVARERAEALAKIQVEAKAKAEKERLQKEAEQRALEEKKERERQERLAREEKERKEREAKEEAARIHFEKFNPKLTATPEEVDGGPDKFFGKRLYFDNVRLKGGEAIRKPKDLEEYTLGVTSKASKYYSPVVLGSLFFSVDNSLIQSLQKEWDLIDMFPRARIYCEIRSYEKKPGAKPIPQAHIFKVQIYNSSGSLVKTWEEPEPEAAKEEGDKKKDEGDKKKDEGEKKDEGDKKK